MADYVLIRNGVIKEQYKTGQRADFKVEGVSFSVSPLFDGWNYGEYSILEVRQPEPVEGKGVTTNVVLVDGVPYYTQVDLPPPSVPDRVTSRQFFLQLYKMNLLEAVNGWVDLQDYDIQLAFNKSATFVRNDPMLQEGFNALGFTAEQIDEFFSVASEL